MRIHSEQGKEYKTIETASANQTYAAQLTTLNAKFSTLTQAQKEKCIIVSYNSTSEASYQYAVVNLKNGIFTRTSSDETSFTIEYLRLDTKVSYKHAISKISGGSNNAARIDTTNQTSSTNSSILYLKMLS